MKGLRILLRHQQTKLFFQTIGSWVSDENEAANFMTAVEAIGYSQLHLLGDTEVVFKNLGTAESDTNFARISPEILSGHKQSTSTCGIKPRILRLFFADEL